MRLNEKAARSVIALGLVIAILATSAISVKLAPAQTVAGTIVGTATDQSGAVVPGVSISVTNTATGVVKTAITNEAGQYVVPFLSPGTYIVSGELTGFKKQLISGIVVQVEQRVRVDLQLTVGQVSETVQVESTAPLLNTESSSLGQVIENKRVVDLPLNGRQFLELAYLVPATHAAAPGHVNVALSGIAVTSGGGRPTNNNFTLDGIDNNSPNCGYFAVSPSVDAVQEFKIQTSNYSAEFGRTGGAIINVATKSGTNELNGSLFEFLRNDVFDARNFFNTRDRNGDGKADAEQLRRNQFGFSVGGPVLLPGGYNGRGRTFFFYNQEHLKERKALVQVGRVPTGDILKGDFSKAGYTVYNPYTTRANPSGSGYIRDPFSGNVIPSNLLNPVALKALTFYPQPNNPADPLRNHLNLQPFSRDSYQINTRVDHQFSARDNFFARYAQSDLVRHNPGVLPGMNENDVTLRGKNVALNWVRTFTPQFVNEARAGYNRLNFGILNPRQGTDFASQLGIQGSRGGRLAGFPQFGISGFATLGDFDPYGSIDNIYQWVDTASYIKGRHSMKFGIDVRRIQNDYYIQRAASGQYTLTGQYTGVPGTRLPDGFADFLLGLPSSNNITYKGDTGRTRTTNWNLFYQDDWKVSPNLTVNLGLRYELYTAPVEKSGRQGNMDPKTGVLVYAKGAPLDNPIPGTGITEADLRFPHTKVDRESLMIGDKNNLAPRIGFAYSLLGSKKTVIRGGYGVSFVYFPFSDFTVNSQRFVPFSLRPSATGDANFPTTIPNYDFDVGGARQVLLRGAPPALAGIDPNIHWGDVQQWSLNVQHELRGNILVDVGYIGNKASHLSVRFPINVPLRPEPGSIQSRRPFPAYAGVTQDQSDINNFYGAMTGRIEKRFSKGYSFLLAYTWAKSIGYGSEVYTTAGEVGPQDPRNMKLERGLAPDDVRQRLSLSFIWELPLGKGQRFLADAPAVVNFLVGGWQVNSIMAFQTGFHRTATGGAFLNMDTSARPHQVGNPNRDFTFSVNQAFNTKAFERPPQYTFGTAPRGSIETPGIKNVDLSVVKNNRVRERVNMQFRFEMFNMPNHPNFGVPNSNFDSASFGRISSASDPRLIQFGLKILF